jgi:hypothetical protein
MRETVSCPSRGVGHVLTFEFNMYSNTRARGDSQQLKVLAASSSGIAPVSVYGVAQQADQILFMLSKFLQVLNVRNVECYVVETNYITQLCTDGVHKRTFICPRKKERIL